LIDDLAKAQASLLQALGAAGGEMILSRAEAPSRFGEHWQEALTDLESAALVALDSGGVLRAGPRGSVLDGAAIERLCGDCGFGKPVEILASTPSTNDFVLDRAQAGAGPGLVVAAELQTAGRGRRGRAFDSRPGLGVWSTTLLPPPGDPVAAPRHSLVTALAVAAAVERLTGACPGIKWPNDVRLGGRKISGILVEARSRAGRLIPVAGIGVNVHHQAGDFPPELRDLAGSVEAQTGTRVERSELLAAIVIELAQLSSRERAGRLELAERFATFDELFDREISVEHPGGRWRGIARGIEEDGSLLLAVPGQGTRVVRAGEATLHGA